MVGCREQKESGRAWGMKRERGREGEERLFEGPEDRWRGLRGKPDVSKNRRLEHSITMKDRGK